MPHPRPLSSSRLIVALVVAHVAVPPLAHAYIDPLSGSLLLQALVAGVLGALLSIKRVGAAVREFFARTWKRLTG
jgi:hypothetical protein